MRTKLNSSLSQSSTLHPAEAMCLRVTELEDAVKSLTDGEWRGRGARRSAIGPAYGGTVGHQFPGWRGKPGAQVWRVFHLISNAGCGIPGEGKTILIRQTLDS